MDLNEYAATEPSQLRRKWCEAELPEDIQRQILETDGSVPHATVVRWLRKLGFEDATTAKVSHFRRGTP